MVSCAGKAWCLMKLRLVFTWYCERTVLGQLAVFAEDLVDQTDRESAGKIYFLWLHL